MVTPLNTIKNKIVNFLKKEFKKRNRNLAIIGISGGIDSAVAATLAKEANLNLLAVLLPFKKKSYKYAKEVINFLNLPKSNILEIDIAPFVYSQVKALKRKGIILDKISLGNLILRQRMMFLMVLKDQMNGLVIGSQNLSEHLLGYFTLYGDSAADIFPLAGLWKTQIYKLADFLKIPKQIIERKPTGDWPYFSDEKELGFDYEYADEILYFYLIKKMSPEDIIKRYNFDKKLVKKVIERYKITSFKRSDPPRYLFKRSK
jgi:NAD+ synthase